MIELITLGILLAIFANFVQNTGVNLQKYSHTRNEENHNYNYVTDKIWLSGILLNVLGALCELSSLAFAPQSIIAPIGAISILINMIYSKFLHNNIIDRKMCIFTGIILIGNVISIICAPKREYVQTNEDVYNLFQNVNFICYIIFFPLLVILLNIYVRKYNTPKIQRLIFPTLSGIAGGMNVLFAKSLSKLIFFYFEKHEEKTDSLKHFITFLFLGAVITCSFLHIKWLNMGLSRFSTLYIYPLNKSMWIISSILGGIIVFQESKDFEDKPVKATFFAFGMLIMCVGIFKISTEQISREVDIIELKDVNVM
jgi:hypothetical protein|tara:strand:- start:3606 stop:4541 length:936 start_codon:yes stop_codon:yes gene_type:complete